MSVRLSWAEIDLNAICHNLSQVKKRIGRKVKILAAVKANAYGHGIREVAEVLEKKGVDYLGVAFLEEGIELRKHGCKIPILVFSHILPQQAGDIVRYNLTASISILSLACAISKEAIRRNKVAKVHIKVDTGMGRLGIREEELPAFTKIFELKGLEVEGIYTHFSSAYEDEKSFTRAQISQFKKIVSRLFRQGYNIPISHAANSAAIINFSESFFDMVRPGLMLYGLYPSASMERYIDLKPALALKTRITFLKDIPPNTPISYGRTYVTKTPTRIGILPIGYADGYSRHLSNIGEVLIHGKRCKVIGAICMDHTIVDVKGVEVNVGDEVVLIGGSGRGRITAEELARKAGTISYEIVSRIGPRIPRVYKSS